MQHKHGFTIIEVVLFLAISGGLAVMLLAGTSAAIQRQQYRDSVESFANFLSTQYSRVISIENDRNNDATCPLLPTETTKRGQSNCVIVGRYIVTTDDSSGNAGRTYEVYPVYALNSTDVWSYGLGDVDTTYEVNWGTRTRLANQASETISLLMYRNPENGTITIRSSEARYTDISELIGLPSGAPVSQEICVYDSGWLPGERRSVFIGARASSSDAVTVNNATDGCADV